MMSAPLLKVVNLKVAFKLQQETLQAVQGISFEIHSQEILAIVGESGCGKSATARALVKLLPSSTFLSGEVLFQNQNLLALPEHKLQKIRGKEIGMIFQDPMTSLNPTMKISHQIIEGYLLHHKTANRAEALDYAAHLLELVGVQQAYLRMNEYPHTLSGGMRQRVMIALALAAKPKIIVADEPTTALDVTIQAQILDLLQSLKEKTATSFLLITHDMSIVAGYADKMMVMYAGKIVEQGQVQRIFERPFHPYTKGLLHAIPRLDMDKNKPLEPIEGAPPNLTEIMPGCAFSPRCKCALPICHSQTPSLCSREENHSVACWNTDESLN